MVTKKEFEDAVAVVEKAIADKQLMYSLVGAEKTPVEALRFLMPHGESLSFKHVTFLAPELAVKNNLHELRNRIKVVREGFQTNQKNLEALEAQEQKFVKELALLKE